MEGFVAATTIGSMIYAYNEQIAVAGVAKREGGNIKALPLDFFARIVTPIHFVAMFITPAAYLFGITVNGLSSTGWLAQYDLPAEWDVTFGEDGKLLVRAAGIFISMAVWKLMSVVFHYLGSQWHYLGLREKPKIVSSGPYGWVRHPLYFGFLAQELAQIPLYWSYLPLLAFAATALALVIKIPIEENIIKDDAIIGHEYKAYEQKVPSRVIPGIY
ncbi:hypothetical protein BDP27DRAFT_1217655 [Rhodocollybia butyracea]|uniref:Protein-S-isoprenylcysteine O-methyltransferase n=1 Tax=Rhodocollybia butyracea TaxID=206335 RepID=A0A9P5PU81_9AGAR|nr:hypothetical protein BDP27DRAFT_1217655 [Rhodocollybia butyracea]